MAESISVQLAENIKKTDEYEQRLATAEDTRRRRNYQNQLDLLNEERQALYYAQSQGASPGEAKSYAAGITIAEREKQKQVLQKTVKITDLPAQRVYVTPEQYRARTSLIPTSGIGGRSLSQQIITREGVTPLSITDSVISLPTKTTAKDIIFAPGLTVGERFTGLTSLWFTQPRAEREEKITRQEVDILRRGKWETPYDITARRETIIPTSITMYTPEEIAASGYFRGAGIVLPEMKQKEFSAIIYSKQAEAELGLLPEFQARVTAETTGTELEDINKAYSEAVKKRTFELAGPETGLIEERYRKAERRLKIETIGGRVLGAIPVTGAIIGTSLLLPPAAVSTGAIIYGTAGLVSTIKDPFSVATVMDIETGKIISDKYTGAATLKLGLYGATTLVGAYGLTRGIEKDIVTENIRRGTEFKKPFKFEELRIGEGQQFSIAKLSRVSKEGFIQEAVIKGKIISTPEGQFIMPGAKGELTTKGLLDWSVYAKDPIGTKYISKQTFEIGARGMSINLGEYGFPEAAISFPKTTLVPIAEAGKIYPGSKAIPKLVLKELPYSYTKQLGVGIAQKVPGEEGLYKVAGGRITNVQQDLQGAVLRGGKKSIILEAQRFKFEAPVDVMGYTKVISKEKFLEEFYRGTEFIPSKSGTAFALKNIPKGIATTIQKQAFLTGAVSPVRDITAATITTQATRGMIIPVSPITKTISEPILSPYYGKGQYERVSIKQLVEEVPITQIKTGAFTFRETTTIPKQGLSFPSKGTGIKLEQLSIEKQKQFTEPAIRLLPKQISRTSQALVPLSISMLGQIARPMQEQIPFAISGLKPMQITKQVQITKLIPSFGGLGVPSPITPIPGIILPFALPPFLPPLPGWGEGIGKGFKSKRSYKYTPSIGAVLAGFKAPKLSKAIKFREFTGFMGRPTITGRKTSKSSKKRKKK